MVGLEGPSYRPLSSPTSSRSVSLPCGPSGHFSTSLSSSSASGDEKKKNGRRKFGIFLTSAAAGTITASLWSYGELKKQQEEYEKADSRFLGVAEAATKVVEKSSKTDDKIPSRREKYNFIADVVDETASALVYIEIKDMGVRDYFSGEPTTSSNGSGFLVQSDGLILTNAHVVINKPRASVQVRLQDGRTFVGHVEDVDVKSDLATVRIDVKSEEMPVMRLGQSSTVRPGEFVIAMGSPLSLSNTITTGVVSSVARNKHELGLRGRDVPDYIQTDAAITFGNSGGPLINLDGEAIGINSMKVTPGISFAIPIDYAKEFLRRSEEARKAGGHPEQKLVRRRYIGITMLAINGQIIDELRTKLGMHSDVTHGIVVFRVVHGSPADRAGIVPGDIITHINGGAIHGTNDVYKLLEGRDDLDITVVRKSETIRVQVRPEV